ncbi:hypothetical protein IKS57_06325 [bacterium]|nr:hypothetical protein [bacterium]
MIVFDISSSLGMPNLVVVEPKKLINTNCKVPSLPGIGIKLFATVATFAKL